MKREKEITMHTITIGTTIQGKVVTIVKNMDIYLRTALEHTSRGTGTVQQRPRHPRLKLTRAKKKLMLNISGQI